jgi:type III restriction enzyme
MKSEGILSESLGGFTCIRDTKNFEKLRNSEADKIKCGRKYFEDIGVNFNVITISAEV